MTQQGLTDLVGVNKATSTNWKNGKREPELDKIVELAKELNATVDYLMGNSDINLLDTSKEGIRVSEEDTTELSASLMTNLNAIIEAGKQKIKMTDDEVEAMKVLVIKEFLKEAEEHYKTHSSKP